MVVVDLSVLDLWQLCKMLFLFQMFAGNDVFCHGEVVTCYNVTYCKQHCWLYRNIPCFSASELSVFSIKEPQTYLRNSWMLLKTKFKVLILFAGNYYCCSKRWTVWQVEDVLWITSYWVCICQFVIKSWRLLMPWHGP